jgi:hypothetical protein
MPLFEWTFRAGDLLTLVGGLSVAAAFLYRRGGDDITMKLTLVAMTGELSEIQTEIKKIGTVLINQADQNRRIIHLEDDVRELRHGRGFIRGPDGIEREYP